MNKHPGFYLEVTQAHIDAANAWRERNCFYRFGAERGVAGRRSCNCPLAQAFREVAGFTGPTVHVLAGRASVLHLGRTWDNCPELQEQVDRWDEIGGFDPGLYLLTPRGAS